MRCIFCGKDECAVDEVRATCENENSNEFGLTAKVRCCSMSCGRTSLVHARISLDDADFEPVDPE